MVSPLLELEKLPAPSYTVLVSVHSPKPPTSRFLLLSGRQNLAVCPPSAAPQFVSHLALCTYQLSSLGLPRVPLSLGRATESAFLPKRISVDVLTSPGLVKFPSQPSNLHVELITWAALHLSPNYPFGFFFWRSNWLRGIVFPGLLRKDTSRLSPPVPGLPLYYQSPLTDRAGAQPLPIPLIPASLVRKGAALPSLPHTARHPRIENLNPQL